MWEKKKKSLFKNNQRVTPWIDQRFNGLTIFYNWSKNFFFFFWRKMSMNFFINQALSLCPKNINCKTLLGISFIHTCDPKLWMCY